MDKKMLIDFGKRLRALRESKGLKQQEMADMMGLTVRQYQRYEYGEAGESLHTLVLFADFYGVTTDYLLGREKQ